MTKEEKHLVELIKSNQDIIKRLFKIIESKNTELFVIKTAMLQLSAKNSIVSDDYMRLYKFSDFINSQFKDYVDSMRNQYEENYDSGTDSASYIDPNGNLNKKDFHILDVATFVMMKMKEKLSDS